MTRLRNHTAVLHWLPPTALFAFLGGVAVSTPRTSYAIADLLQLGLIYALVAIVVSGLSCLVARRGAWFEVAAALLVGTVATWHLREQFHPAVFAPSLWAVEGMLQFAAFVLIAAAAQFLLNRLTPATPPRQTRVGLLLVTAVIFFVVLSVSYHTTEMLRWHLLRHNTLIGTPAFHLFSPRVIDLEDDAWARHDNGAITQPDWVHDGGFSSDVLTAGGFLETVAARLLVRQMSSSSYWTPSEPMRWKPTEATPH